MSDRLLDHAYDLPPALLALGVMLLMAGANEYGFRIGRYRSQRESEAARSVSRALKGTTLGLVALLLGFSYSITSSKFFQRQRLMLDEANAIGTCDLRAQLLDEPARSQIRHSLSRFTAAQIEFIDRALDPAAAKNAEETMNQALNDLWSGVHSAVSQDSDRARTALIVPAANAVIDLSATRKWSGYNHMPPSMIALLIVCMGISGGLVGHSSGQANSRHAGLWMTLNLLVTLILFVVLDFDRPRRGLIQINHQPLIELRDSLVPLPLPTTPGPTTSG